MKINILLVEDDANMGYLVQDYLEMKGFDVTLAADGVSALALFMNGSFQLCVFDVMLPQKDGFTLASDIRRFNTQIPIIFLTAKSLKEDRLKGFELGGDDYLTKPFSIEELHFRIEAVLKRTYDKPTRADERLILKFGNSSLDLTNQILTTGEQRTELTYRETKLLHLLCRHKNKVLDRDLILKSVWEDEGIIVGRSVDVFLSRLRKLLKDNTAVKITNIHSVGYRFDVVE
jgi:two-component system, OmpR family, response regulator